MARLILTPVETEWEAERQRNSVKKRLFAESNPKKGSFDHQIQLAE
jgi:hypothetical protein